VRNAGANNVVILGAWKEPPAGTFAHLAKAAVTFRRLSTPQMRQFNGHRMGCQSFAARRRLAQFVAQPLPKACAVSSHGRWRDIAMIELNASSLQGLDRCLADRADFHAKVAAREARCHVAGGTIDRRCTTDDARIKLK
jgi:hypothetical protein